MNTKLTVLLKSVKSVGRGSLSVAINTEVPKAGLVPRPKYWYQSSPTADRWSIHFSQLNLLSSTSSQPGKHTNLSECFYAAKQTIIHSKRHSPFSHADRMLSEGWFKWQTRYKSLRCVPREARLPLTWGQCWFLSLVFLFSHSLKRTHGSDDLNVWLTDYGSGEVMPGDMTKATQSHTHTVVEVQERLWISL